MSSMFVRDLSSSGGNGVKSSNNVKQDGIMKNDNDIFNNFNTIKRGEDGIGLNNFFDIKEYCLFPK